jgi:hypothetical protein
MKLNVRSVFTALALLLVFSSCTRYISTYEAANGKAKCGRALR